MNAPPQTDVKSGCMMTLCATGKTPDRGVRDKMEGAAMADSVSHTACHDCFVC